MNREAGWAACSAVGPATRRDGRTDTHLSSLSGIARHRQTLRGSGPGSLRHPRWKCVEVEFEFSWVPDEAHGLVEMQQRGVREQRKSGRGRQAKKAKEIGTGRAGGLSWRRVGGTPSTLVVCSASRLVTTHHQPNGEMEIGIRPPESSSLSLCRYSRIARFPQPPATTCQINFRRKGRQRLGRGREGNSFGPGQAN